MGHGNAMKRSAPAIQPARLIQVLGTFKRALRVNRDRAIEFDSERFQAVDRRFGQRDSGDVPVADSIRGFDKTQTVQWLATHRVASTSSFWKSAGSSFGSNFFSEASRINRFNDPTMAA
jgi:hypothetical protein